MAGAKEIRTKIKSVENTQKITSAMEMVAASKMRKAQDRMRAARPYAEKIRQVISHVSAARSEYHHPFTVMRSDIKRIGYIIVSTDRGLCGGLNNNLFRSVVRDIEEWRGKGVEAEVRVIGNKGAVFFRRFGTNILAQATHLGDIPNPDDLIGSIKVILDAYIEGKIDRVYLVANRFVNSMTQTAFVEQLIPREASQEQEMTHYWDYLYEPDAKEVIDQLMMRYVESLVYQAVLENIASEMAARMVAMKAASDNAGELISELNLQYNKARQASITQELSEIVGGAAAI